MKQILITLLLTLALIGELEAKHHKPWHFKVRDHVELEGSVGFFYSSLSPYGQWVDSRFGYAWRPIHIVRGWRPYLYGQWIWTDYGWYWVSNEPFGWATFHYGRWHYDDYYGWIWIPDDVWGPAWVEWRYDDDYIGWAPLTPYASFSVNVGISFSSGWVTPVHYWNFVSCRNFTSPGVVEYIQPLERTRRLFGTTRGAVDIRFEGNRVINRGIDVGFVERRTNTRVNRVEVVQRDRADGDRLVRDANRERVEVFRPRLDGQRGTPPVMRHGDQRIGADGERFPQESTQHYKRDRASEKPEFKPRDYGRDTRKQEEKVRERPLPERKLEPVRPPERGFRQDRQTQEMWRGQEQHRDQVQQRHEDQFSRENRRRENPRWQPQQPQVRERPQPVQRPEESRGGRERGHRP
ncbi:MAG: hypothetical protein HYR76_11955 [Ignavibacteria bacterium]|nr:hypothetical protein [Ignavibacteria bacterium]MBI3766045.1 hypothetical protein [Ignavibacteriales bacterium]